MADKLLMFTSYFFVLFFTPAKKYTTIRQMEMPAYLEKAPYSVNLIRYVVKCCL